METLKTFKEWSAKGCRIKKGAKSVGRNERREHLFSSSQVWSPEDTSYDSALAAGYNFSMSIGDNHWDY